ncbi:hypothetical protein D3C84_1239800 [compost metagenome]
MKLNRYSFSVSNDSGLMNAMFFILSMKFSIVSGELLVKCISRGVYSTRSCSIRMVRFSIFVSFGII